MNYEEAIDKFLKNPYWKAIYEGAPDKCKEFYQQHFAYSLDAVDKTDHESKVIDLYKSFSPSDWDYLIGHTQQKMGKWGYEQARKQYEVKEENQPSQGK